MLSVDSAQKRAAQWEKRREHLGGALWVFPVSFMVLALVSGTVFSLVKVPPDSWLSPVLFKGSPDEARRLLLTVATSIVGIFALVVGLTMVALQMATNRYSPRLLRNFLRDRPTQFVLGVFVGGFTYNAAGLYTVGIEPGEYQRLAVTAGLASLFACIGALIYYVDHMVHSIQIDTVLRKIGSITTRTIAMEPPGIGGNSGEPIEPSLENPPESAVQIDALSCGYVQFVHPELILPVATAQNLTIRVAVAAGDHLVSGLPLAWVWSNEAGRAVDAESLSSTIHRAVSVGFERTMRQDVAVGMEQIVDIALLSMHNFDFHTAVQSTNELSVILAKLGTKSLGTETYADVEGTVRVVVPAKRFEDYVDLAVGQIRRRGANEPVVLSALAAMLRNLGTLVTTDDRRACVAEQIQGVLAAAHRSVPDSADVLRVQTEADTAMRPIAV